VGNWGWAIAFFGFVGGLIGFLSLRQDDPRRADHVLKWGLIVSLASSVLWFGLFFVVAAALSQG
jgi:hypothetical protein